VNLPLLGTLLLGGIAALDATPVAQTMLFQPLVTAALLGTLWGNLKLALEVGVVLQILAASTSPLGARTPEDYASGGVVGVGLALALATREPFAMYRESCALLGVLAGLVVALAGVPLLKWQRRRNEGLARWCEAELRGGREGALSQSQAAAVVLAFGSGVAYCAVGLGLGDWILDSLVSRESLRLSRAWEAAEPLWLGFGLAQLLSAFVQRRMARAAVFGAALVGAWLVLLIGSS
jgi:mannose/fructose/N-acetylgalactosamine-specific phosphotransferase system component IIC